MPVSNHSDIRVDTAGRAADHATVSEHQLSPVAQQTSTTFADVLEAILCDDEVIFGLTSEPLDRANRLFWQWCDWSRDTTSAIGGAFLGVYERLYEEGELTGLTNDELSVAIVMNRQLIEDDTLSERGRAGSILFHLLLGTEVRRICRRADPQSEAIRVSILGFAGRILRALDRSS